MFRVSLRILLLFGSSRQDWVIILCSSPPGKVHQVKACPTDSFKKIENKNAGIAAGIRELLLSFVKKYFVQWKAGKKQNIREEMVKKVYANTIHPHKRPC